MERTTMIGWLTQDPPTPSEERLGDQGTEQR